MPQNFEIWEHWGVMNEFDRPQSNGFGGIPTINSKTIRDYCRDFDFSEFEYRKLLAVEQAFKKAMIANKERKDRMEKNKEEFNKKMQPITKKRN